MQSYPWLQVSARGEVTAVLTGEKYLLRDIDDPVEFFLAKRNEQAGFDLIDAPAPYAHVAADTTNNCNLRCPFCIDDFTFATHDRMTKDDFLKLTSMGELVWDGGLWLSCLFEPFLHPDFFRFLELVPPLGKQKCMLTTNLAVKRFKPEAVEAVAAANLNYINISVDSMTRDTYEKLRVNADYDVFWANLENLAGTFQRAPAPPQLRFISVVFRSNYREIPDMLRMSHERFGVTQHEVRLPFGGMTFAPKGWAQSESLSADEWVRLEEQIATLPYHIKVMPTGFTQRYYPGPVAGLFA